MNMAFYLNFNTGLLIRVSLVRAQVEEPIKIRLPAVLEALFFPNLAYFSAKVKIIELFSNN